MTQYSDVPAANMLYAEQQRVGQAIDMIDAEGVLASFVVGPPPTPPAATPAAMPPISPPAMMMAVPITVGPPNDPQLMAALRNWLVERQGKINDELAALGVTDTPPAARAQGAKP